MGFLDSLRKILGGGGPVSGAAAPGYWIYVRCRRCGEPLKTRIDLRNDPSLADDGENYIVRKGLVGSGTRRCFQTVEVALTFDSSKQKVLDRDITGGEFITEEEYEELLRAQAEEQAREEQETGDESGL